MKHSNPELSDKIGDILCENIIWGEKNKTVYLHKIVPLIVKLFSETVLEVIGKDEAQYGFGTMDGEQEPPEYYSAEGRNLLRSEQRAKLNKIIGGK